MKLYNYLIILSLLERAHGGAARNMPLRDAHQEHRHPQQTPAFIDPDDKEVVNRLRESHLRGDGLSITDFGIKDEREAFSFCTYFINMLNIIPGFVTCTCSTLLLMTLDFRCEAALCANGISETVNNLLNNTQVIKTFVEQPKIPELLSVGATQVQEIVMGIIGDDACVVPSYAGSLITPLLQLTSKVCNAPIRLNVTVSEDAPFELDLPEVCATVGHQNGGNLLSARHCGFQVGEFECDCSICESGSDISLDCSRATALGSMFAPLMQFECVGMSMFGMNKNGLPVEPFINPLLILGTEEFKAKMRSSSTP